MKRNGTKLVSGTGGRMIRAMRAADVQADGPEGQFSATVLRYNVRDDYNTEFEFGVFTESLRVRMPRIAWGHDWRELVGQWTDADDNPQRLRLLGQLDLAMINDSLPSVPRAHQAYAQLKSGTADQFSVGFMPTEWRDVETQDEYYRVFTKGRLDEVSIVLAGAVPGTELLAVRSAGGGIPLLVREPLVPKEKVAALIVRLQTGDIDLADALQELKVMPATADTDDDETETGGDGTGGSQEASGEPTVTETVTETVTTTEVTVTVEVEDEDGNVTEVSGEVDETTEGSDGLDELDDADIAAALELVSNL